MTFEVITRGDTDVSGLRMLRADPTDQHTLADAAVLPLLLLNSVCFVPHPWKLLVPHPWNSYILLFRFAAILLYLFRGVLSSCTLHVKKIEKKSNPKKTGFGRLPSVDSYIFCSMCMGWVFCPAPFFWTPLVISVSFFLPC